MTAAQRWECPRCGYVYESPTVAVQVWCQRHAGKPVAMKVRALRDVYAAERQEGAKRS